MRMSVNNLLLPKFRKGDTFYMLFIFISLVLFFIATVYPIVFVLSASFTDPKIVASGKLLLLPVEPTLEGYKRILAYEDIWTGYANTIYYTVLGTLLNLVATLPCAYALSRRISKAAISSWCCLLLLYFSGGLIPGYLNVRSLAW